ncbi:STAS domain-containing protein [Gracilibacillus marinus]|uniref:STAS domain-containing protein n=1 Tax=Gracilibacillus marinus TaxID=630535 RepID=A0ABV8VX96_9BACI
MTESLHVSLSDYAQTRRITLQGILDYSTISEISHDVYIIPATIKEIILDIEQVDFIDSTGVGLFIHLIHQANENDSKLTIAGGKEVVVDTLETLGVYQILSVM